MISIEKISAADAQTLLHIAKKTFIETYAKQNTAEDLDDYLRMNFTLDQLSDELRNPECFFYLVQSEGNVVGYLKLNIGKAQTELSSQNGLEIERIYVLQSQQGKKIGKALFDLSIQIAQEQRVEFVWLGVWEHNTKAIGFYERMGFKAFDTHVFMFGRTEQRDIMMKLKL